MAAEPKKIKALQVQSTVEGFRRAGRPWSREATTVPLAEFNKQQIAQLRDEKMLVVTDVEIEAPVETVEGAE